MRGRGRPAVGSWRAGQHIISTQQPIFRYLNNGRARGAGGLVGTRLLAGRGMNATMNDRVDTDCVRLSQVYDTSMLSDCPRLPPTNNIQYGLIAGRE